MTRVLSLRVPDDLAEWAGSYAKQRGVTRQALCQVALEAFRDECGRGVPDLESASDETPRPSPAGREAKSKVAGGPARSAATASQGASRPAPTRDPRTIPGVKSGTELWRLRPLIDVVALRGPRPIGAARARVRLAERRVSVDGLTVKDPELKVDPRSVTVSEQAIRSAREELRERKTI